MLGQSILYCYGARPSPAQPSPAQPCPAVLITPIVSVSNEVSSCSSRENYCVVIAWTSNTSDNILGSGHQISDLLQFNIAVCLLIWYPLQLCSVLLCPILSINEKWSRYITTQKAPPRQSFQCTPHEGSKLHWQPADSLKPGSGRWLVDCFIMSQSIAEPITVPKSGSGNAPAVNI